MPTPSTPFKIAAVQAAPMFLNREATVEKACRLISEAAHQGARLIVFPESFIPTYPDWVWAVPPGRERILNQLYADFLANAVEIPGAATETLAQAARKAGAYLVMGVTERDTTASGASLYNTLLYFSPEGNLMGKHRKLVPTGGERLVWAQGDGSTLEVYDTPLGKIGGLICWENYMPLARYTMYAWGTQIYIAATWDRGEPWLSTLRHIAKEGRVYVIGCCTALRSADIPDQFEYKDKFYSGSRDWINEGDSAIVNPDGEFIAGPVRMKEEILYAEVDPAQMRGPKWMLDVAGHYARPDVFELIVHRKSHPMIQIAEDRQEAEGEKGEV
ncbi:MAG TPA: carbon-nitrogen hydrolase family protein [Thermodesulfobacteriota bacterium]|nr:carbon-nitrogen hydrolase family protein [Thermodesulfobacteriota bacterium]